jgi:inorganic phosphate transporter, PiT family
MTAEGALLLASASGFAVVSGANDGATLTVMGTRTRRIAPSVAIVGLTVFVALGPLLVGTAVATTLAHRLVSFGGGDGRMALLAAVVASLVVVFALNRSGTPTSLTLALTGGIVGAGLGAGLPVQWPTIAGVLAVGLAAPLLSVPAGWLVYRIMGGPLGKFIASHCIDGAQYAGYLLLALAYSANDAQKMVAIVAIGTSAQLDPVAAKAPSQAVIAVLFGVGVLLTVRTLAARVGEGLMYIRTPHFIATSVGASLVVLASSLLGVPVSTTQAATGAAVGSGVATTPFGVRWKEVSRIGVAWVVTLPFSVALGAALAAAGRLVQ